MRCHQKRVDAKLYTFGPNGQGFSDWRGCWLDDLEPRNDFIIFHQPFLQTLRKEEQAGGAEILLASLTGAKRVSLLEACNFWASFLFVWVRLFLARSRFSRKKTIQMPFHQLAGRIQGP